MNTMAMQLKAQRFQGKVFTFESTMIKKNAWEAKEALTKFSTPLMLQLQTYSVLHLHKVEAHKSNHKIMLVISDTAA